MNLSARPLAALAGIRHAFFTRHGGVSRGFFASLNCGLGSADDAAAVRENRARAARALDARPENLVTLHQVHGITVINVDRPWTTDVRPQADALVSTTPGIALGALAADCAPILFADARARVVGAAHAGWRGALAGVIGATVEAMCAAGARAPDIVASVGPCIGRESYEVGPEFPGPFIASDPANARFFRPAARAGHFMFDLAGYCAARLEAAGVGTVAVTGQDTCAPGSDFFSYRRAVLNGERDYGRGLSAIMLEP